MKYESNRKRAINSSVKALHLWLLRRKNIIYHSSEKRGLCSTNVPAKHLDFLLYYSMYKKRLRE